MENNTIKIKLEGSGQDGGIHRNSTSLNNQKEDNGQSKISKQPEVPENQTAWNSDNLGIKETVKQNNQTGKNPR